MPTTLDAEQIYTRLLGAGTPVTEAAAAELAAFPLVPGQPHESVSPWFDFSSLVQDGWSLPNPDIEHFWVRLDGNMIWIKGRLRIGESWNMATMPELLRPGGNRDIFALIRPGQACMVEAWRSGPLHLSPSSIREGLTTRSPVGDFQGRALSFAGEYALAGGAG